MPTLSVIIPVYNDPNGIDQTLRSVIQQEYSAYEIIPVDNNSSDKTPSVINEWAERHPDRIRPTEERDLQSSYAARNAGIEHASGEILVFIDADMTVPENWLQQIAAKFDNSKTDYLGYEVTIYVPEKKGGIWGWYDKMMGLPSRYHYEQKQFVPTSCLAVRKEVFDQLGLFNEQMISGGDKEFGQRVHNAPYLNTKFTDEIVVYHPARTTFEEQRKKALRVGRGMAQLYQQSTPGRRSSSLLSDVLHHISLPSPFRIYSRCDGLSEFLLLYILDSVIRYIRLYGILSALRSK